MAYFRCEKSTKILKKLLWTNPSPNSAFAAQTISNIDLSKYDGVIIELKGGTSYADVVDTIYCSKDFNGWLKSGANGEKGWAFKRSLQISGQSFIFGGGSGNNAVDDNYAIPIGIYGYAYEPDMLRVAEKNLLWNNPSPTSAFNAQTLSLDLSKYEAVIIRCSWATNYNTDGQKPYQLFNYVPKDGVQHIIGSSLNTSGAANLFGRKVTVTDTGITFTIAGYPMSTLATTNAGYIIPTEIYGYVYEPDVVEPDKRKFILKDGVFQGTQGTDYGVLGTLTQSTGFVTISSGAYSTGIAPFISAEDKTKYKRVVFDADNVSNAIRMYYSTTETGSRTHVNTNQWAVNLNTLNNNIFLYFMPNGTMNYYNIYLE